MKPITNLTAGANFKAGTNIQNENNLKAGTSVNENAYHKVCTSKLIRTSKLVEL